MLPAPNDILSHPFETLSRFLRTTCNDYATQHLSLWAGIGDTQLTFEQVISFSTYDLYKMITITPHRQAIAIMDSGVF